MNGDSGASSGSSGAGSGNDKKHGRSGEKILITDMRRQYGYRPPSLSAYDRQKSRLQELQHYYPHAKKRLDQDLAQREMEQQRRMVTDHDIIKRHYRFIREHDSDSGNDSGHEDEEEKRRRTKRTEHEGLHEYGERMAKKYESKLYREYCLVDLSRADQFLIGMRWRTEREVLKRKGELICAEMSCKVSEDDAPRLRSDGSSFDGRLEKLSTFEVPFTYVEHGHQKAALVKLRLCTSCASKLRKVQRHKEEKQREQEDERNKRRIEGEEENGDEGNALTKRRKKHYHDKG